MCVELLDVEVFERRNHALPRVAGFDLGSRRTPEPYGMAAPLDQIQDRVPERPGVVRRNQHARALVLDQLDDPSDACRDDRQRR